MNPEFNSFQLGTAEAAENLRRGMMNIIPDIYNAFNPKSPLPHTPQKPTNPRLYPKELKELHPYYYAAGSNILGSFPAVPEYILSGLNEPTGKSPQERMKNRGVNIVGSFAEGYIPEPDGKIIWDKLKHLPKK